MEREGDRAKKGSEVRRSFVIDVEEGKRVRERFEEGDDRGEGGDVGGGRAVFERGEVDVPEVNGVKCSTLSVNLTTKSIERWC